MYALHRINHHLTADGSGRDSIVMLDGTWRGGKINGILWPPNKHPYFSRPLGPGQSSFKFPKEAMSMPTDAPGKGETRGSAAKNRTMARSGSAPVLHRELQSSFSDWCLQKELRAWQTERAWKMQRSRELHLSQTNFGGGAGKKMTKSQSAAQLGATR